jgi:hypothetical protein
MSRILFAVAVTLSLSPGPAGPGAPPPRAKEVTALRAAAPWSECYGGCWRSYDYCRRFQSRDVDCSDQLASCFDFCDDVYGD